MIDQKESPMGPSRPYLIRALNDWILDNGGTPHLLIDATINDVMVPEQYVADGQIILNINPSAVQNLMLGNQAIEFNAKFGGVSVNVYVPVLAVVAIYARETGQGMGFGMEPGIPDPDGPKPSRGKQFTATSSVKGKTKTSRTTLKVVK
jgi:stringent starvation protein B